MEETIGRYAKISEWIYNKLTAKIFLRENLIRILNLPEYIYVNECQRLRTMIEQWDTSPKSLKEINELVTNENIYNALQAFKNGYTKDTSIRKQSTKKIPIGTKPIGKSKRVTLRK